MTSFPAWMGLILAAACLLKPCQPIRADGTSGQPPPGGLPEWVDSARWYYVKVPRFRNGDQENDLEGVLPWTSPWPPEMDAAQALKHAANPASIYESLSYGGDLKGVIDSIPYLKELGISAILLSPVFDGAAERTAAQIDLRHVDDSLGVRDSLVEARLEQADPKSWVWTRSDMLLRELIQKAHDNGMRVVLGGFFAGVLAGNAPPAEQEFYFQAATRRWMDPDGDGKPGDGVDGWFVSIEEGIRTSVDEKNASFWRRWREHVRQLNANAVVIAGGTLSLTQLGGGVFDLALHSAPAGALSDLLRSSEAKSAGAKSLFDAVASLASLAPATQRTSNLTLMSGDTYPRMLTSLAAKEPLRKGRALKFGPVPDDAARDRWKLAAIISHFLPGAPVTWYGDEVGMFGGPEYFADGPMWWGGPGESAGEHFRPDFFALIQWLHDLRSTYAALRAGEFRPVLMDDATRVLAFSRRLSGEEIVLVVNYGNGKQRIELPLGVPGQMVAVQSPHLHPPRGPFPQPPAGARFAPLSVAGARQFVGPEGKIRMWLDPLTVRVVFLTNSP